MQLVSPDFGLFFWMVLSFTIVLIILRKFAWNPILQALKQRENSIDNALNSAKQAREQMEKLKADNEKIMADAKRERDQLLKEAKEIKTQIIKDAKAEAQMEADRIISAAKEKIQNEKSSAIDEIKSTIAQLSVEIAEKLLQTELQKDNKQEKLMQDIIDNMKMN